MLPRPASTLPFFGRDAELSALVRLLDDAVSGCPRTVVLQGPAGIGKSRLADELAAVARGRGLHVGMGRAWPDEDPPDLWPWRAILQGLGGKAPALAPAPSEAGEVGRAVALLDQIHGLARTGPLLLALDDAHRADPASLRLAALLARERVVPLLLIRRAEAVSGAAEALLSDLAADALILELAGLSPEATTAWLSGASGGAIDDVAARKAWALTLGNPRDLRSLVDQSTSGAAGWQRGLERAIRDRVGALRADERGLLAVAALLGTAATSHEIARIAGTSPGHVETMLARAAGVGLRVEHDDVRVEALAFLSLNEQLDLHARAAVLLAGDAPEMASRRAHHGLEAARASAAAADMGLGIVRDAAGVLRRTGRLEAAATLLERAAALRAAALPMAPAATLAVEHAEAVLACGRLAEARPLFAEAARMAEREDDPVVLARAALGLGGLWVSEHRQTADAESMLALQRRALARLPEAEGCLRARLGMRLAAEDAYRGGSVGPVITALDHARRLGDPGTLADALSLAHHALLTPEHARDRLVLANELIAAATAAGDDLRVLIGICWRAVDLFQLGHPRAAAALDELRVRADLLGCRGVLFVAKAMDAMLAIRAGDFARAETEAASCFALGQEAGDADALAYRGAHLAAIHYFQGREAEFAATTASIAGSVTLIDQRERAFAAAAALFAARAGHPQAARALLEQLGREGLSTIPASSSWLASIAAIAELALLLDDAEVAEAAYRALLPHGHVPVIASLGAVCFGSTHRPLGLAALACGNLDLAIAHFAEGVAANDALGHGPAAICARAELGLARLQRRRGDDDAAGLALVTEAIDAGRRASMAGLVARWRAALPARPGLGEPLIDVAIGRLDNGFWRVAVGGEVATVPDRVGLRYLSDLVGAPDRGIPALGLVLQGADAPSETREAVLDAKAVASVRARIETLHAGERTKDDEEELAALRRELARSVGLWGRVRAFTDSPERARTAVRKAIKRAIEEIAAANPAVGNHLATRVETGTVCCYHRRLTA